jgi:predicted metal-dependent phosphoesterase TrpH/glycosyltransferase involved in cell wall biosynthesis
VPGQERLSIVHVTPQPWGARHEVNDFVENLAPELAERGHRVLVAAPSTSRARVREARRAIRAASDDPERLFAGDGLPRAGGEHGPPVLAVGHGLALPRGARPPAAPVPLDVSRPLDQLLGSLSLDLVHVHDPFAPSTASTALRHSRSLNVASFHEPTERILSTQVARPLVEVFFGRLDARTASSRTTAELLERYFPGSYELVTPGAQVAVEPAWPLGGAREDGSGSGARGGRPARIAFCVAEERGALRLFLRALRRLAPEAAWEAAIWSEAPLPPPRLSRLLRERVRFTGPRECAAGELVAGGDLLCVASGGPHPAPGLVRQALAAGTVPIASQLAVYDELLGDGDLGLLFPAGDAITLAGQLERLVADRALRERLAAAGRRSARSWTDVADDLEATYRRLAARRHDPDGQPDVRRRVAGRKLIEVDLHMHTDHSPDCATPVDMLLETARDRGLGAIAITDHNEISGALEARRLAEGLDGIKVIVAEEVKTAEQGEVIGLFIEEKIPRGMTMSKTVAEIRRQGGLVYVPHPFDRFHSVPDYEHLLEIVEEIDILEVFNPRVAFSAFNEEAERFAAKYRIVPGAGSDSHVAQGLGSVRIRIHDFDGPQEFLEAMRDADITRKHRNLVYVQALKWLQTTAGGGGARRPPGSSPGRPPKGGTRRSARRAAGVRRRPRRGGAGTREGKS